tara:strand:- start:442 stop:765 length:324 start_codon:yes stop_codon:yes gene_type:complete
MVEYTNEKVRRILSDYLKKVKSKFNVDKSILFGSRARGDNFLDSDVDLIIVSKDFESINFRKRMGELLEWWDEYIDLEVIGYTPREFNKKKKQIGIVRQAVKEGVEI